MKTNYLLILSFLGFSMCGKAQTFHHTIGGHYLQTSGVYGNSDRLSFQYNPQVHLQKKSLIYALSLPMTYGVVTSSARADNKAVFEFPVSLELGYNPNYPCIPYKSLSAFVGAGASKQIVPVIPNDQAYFMHAVIGFRLLIRKVPFELRFTGSRSFKDAQLHRFGFGLATEL